MSAECSDRFYRSNQRGIRADLKGYAKWPSPFRCFNLVVIC
jgi:hypothetical protein